MNESISRTSPDADSWDTLLQDFNLLTFDDDLDSGWGLIESGSVAIAGERIAWVGRTDDLPAVPESVAVVTGKGEYLSPGLIDCHTHLVFGGQRADEWQMRQEGRSYEEIAKAGGGILSTVAATRRASEEELFSRTKKRAECLLKQGVTTVEIKSGYGLDLETELKMLRVANRVGSELPLTICPTLLGAHAVPAEFRGRPDDYLDVVVNEMIPAAKGLATSVDVFTERIAFDLKQTERVFQAAVDEGLSIKNHAEQLSCMGGAKLVAEMGGLSSDHLEYLDEAGVEAMARHQTIATLLPGAFYFLRESQKPPIESLRRHSVPIAIATDSNPGSSPVMSLLLMANMACVFWGLTPVEAIRGITVNAATALGLADRVGRLRRGYRADLAIWDIETPAELAYGIGHQPCVGVFQKGRRVSR